MFCFVIHGVASIGKPILCCVLLCPARSCKYWKTYVELGFVMSNMELQSIGKPNRVAGLCFVLLYTELQVLENLFCSLFWYVLQGVTRLENLC